MKKLWGRTDFREKISASQQRVWGSSETRNKISEASRRLWGRSSYREAQEAAHSDPKYLRETRDRSRSLWEDEDFRENQVRIRSDPEWKAEQGRRMAKLWRDPSYRKKTLGSLSSVFVSGFRSRLESVTAAVLRDIGVDFIEQYAVGPYLFDFYVPGSPLLIECQGEYWHSLPDSRRRDASKHSYASLSMPGCPVLYLQEHEFMNPASVTEKLRGALGLSDVPVVFSDFSLRDVSVREVRCRLKRRRSRSEAEIFLESYHYAGFGRSAKAVYGAFLAEDLVAVCKFSNPVRAEVSSKLGFSFSEVLELDRFCIHPSRHKRNFASWLLSRFSSEAFSSLGPKCLVSFADSTMGHTGTIYRAAGWTFAGDVPPDYHYVGPGGWVVHKKTLYNRAVKNGMREREYAERNGYVRIYGRKKRKFVLRCPG